MDGRVGLNHRWLSAPPAGAMFLVFTALAWAIQRSTPELAGLDDYRHARYAAELYAHGFQVFGHPFLPLTVLGAAKADLWLGYHELLALFLRNDETLLERAKIASAFLSAVAPTALYVVLRRRGISHAALWALFAVVCCPAWTYRDLMLRPAPLGLALCLLTFQAASEGRWKTPMVWSAVYAWLHVSAPLAVVMAALGAIGLPRRRWVPMLGAIAGLALGLLTRPDAAEYLRIAWIQGTLPFAGSVPHIGQELRAPSLGELFELELVPLMLGAVGVAFAVRSRRWAELALFAMSLLASLFVRRFTDFLLPSAVLLAASIELPARVRRFAAIALAVSLIPFAAYTTKLVREVFETQVRAVKPAAELLAKSGGLVVNTNCFDFPMYYFHEPNIPFVCGYDPSFLAAANPRLFWIWEHLTREGIYCEARECETQPSRDAPAVAMDALGARWLAIGNAERDATLLKFIEGNPESGLVKRYAADTPDGVVLFERVR